MHEMSLALSIVDLVVEESIKEGGGKVGEVEVEVGNLAGVLIDSLEFCLDAAVRATILEKAEFKIIPTVAQGNCPACQAIFEVDSLYAACPQCGMLGITIVGGQELKVRSFTMEEN
jgi:hydrogenase nickel incorporation protein HypA/HybF